MGLTSKDLQKIIQRPFDPEGTGYDYVSAKKYMVKPDEAGHWPSRVSQTGLILKGRKHSTYYKTIKGEEEAGYEIYEKNKRYYSRKKR